MNEHRAGRMEVLLLTAAVGLAACGGGDAGGDTAPMGGDSAVLQSADAPAGAPASDSVAAVSPDRMTDANVAAIASASNQDEIQTSQIALQKAQNAEVKTFAQRMVDEHTQLEQQMTQLLQQKGITPQPTERAVQIQRAMENALQTLQGATGAAFDQAYVAHQVQSHSTTLQMMDTAIPVVQDAQMKALLEGARPRVQAHLEEAQRLQQQLGVSPGA